MDFFDREEETAELRRLRDQSTRTSRFTVLTGRRRVGKTELVRHALGDSPYIYWLVSRSPEKVQVVQMQKAAEEVFGKALPAQVESFVPLFNWVFQESATHPVTLVIDEFQEFSRVNPGVFSEMAGVWDRLHKSARVNLIVSGSINRMMNQIFFNEGEPLYGRNTGRITLQPFRISVLKEILAHHAPRRQFGPDDLLTLWTLTGGVARYVEQFMDDGAVTREAMLASAFRRSSPMIDEGKVVLIQEFGRDYGTYFSILATVASGQTSYGEIKNAIGIDPGAYLSKLETDYGILTRQVPIFGSEKAKIGHYKIEDRFFRFWFRFIYRYQYLVEMGRFAELLGIVRRDFDTYSGEALEGYFRAKMKEDTSYTRMGGWWDRKGENEIDLVCQDEIARKLDFYEVKRDRRDISLDALRQKTKAYFEKNGTLPGGWSQSCSPLSLEDM